MYPVVLTAKGEAMQTLLHLRVGRAVEFGVRGSVEMRGFRLAHLTVCKTSVA